MAFLPSLPRRSIGVLLAALAASSLGACSLLSPRPALELLKAAGSAGSAALAYGPSKASNTIHHGDAPVRGLCIEYNRDTPLDELVPALQAELKSHGVASRVYDAGSGQQSCQFWLRYVASIEWAIPPLGSEYRPYMSAAALSLHQANGRLMASSAYAVEQDYGISRWSTTRRKIAPVVKAVITGFES